ncbi:fungal-specific transcription factor domain-containing protein [Mycena galopus ATCC 62051]|nr:fungal-specific transcription factor domain-containing protein [Mycena galopus ATCC 62051]
MADDEHANSFPTPNRFRFELARQRPQRSCDICRQRKVRCDGPNMPDSCCSSCISFGTPCTYMNPYRKRGPKNLLVEELKKENESLKAKLRKLSVCSLCAQPLQSGSPENGSAASSTSVFNHTSPESDITTVESEPVDGQDFSADELAARFESFSIENLKTKYYGAASVFALANTAIAARDKSCPKALRHSRRPLFWDTLPWEEEAYAQQPNYVYPDNDLIESLVQIYFTCLHPSMPILHRPTFERNVAEGLHLTNAQFGGLLLSVLALASRYSNDLRVFVDGNPLSSGWNFANQIWILRRLFEPTLHEVQMYYILSIYSLSLSAPLVSWLYLGLGIRFLQQRGEHRRREGRKQHEDEQWKRVFWSFVMMDRYLGAFLGRPMGLYPEEYDVELPLEVDDECWDEGFIQPPGKPSQLSFFICSIQLYEILGDVMRKLYGSKKSKLMLGWDGPDWEPRIVAELDSAVNVFSDSIPSHLRWDPEDPPHGAFFDQAALLYITYNYVRIAIHRQYIQKAIVLTAPSLSICAGAARAIIHTADSWLRKRQRTPPHNIINPVFVSGLVLLLNMLATKRAGIPPDKKSKDLVLVTTAMEILKFAEVRLQPVGRLWELLQEIWSIDGSLPLASNDEHDSTDAGASPPALSPPPPVPRAPPTPAPPAVPAPAPPAVPVQAQPMTLPLSDVPGVPDDFFTQLRKSFEQPMPEASWSTAPVFDQSAQMVSMEQLFPPAQEPNYIFDDELMSMWMAAPTDVANINNWDTYMNNRNGMNANWFTNYEAPQQQQY